MKRFLSILVAILLVVMIPLAGLAGSVSGGGAKLSFSTTTLDGRAVNSNMIKNYDLVLVNYWGTWCGWCVWEMPFLEQVHQNYPNVLILGVWDEYGSLDEAREVADDAGVTYPMLRPAGMLKTFVDQLESFPTSCIYDNQGNQLGEAEVGARDYAGWVQVIQQKLASLPENPLPTLEVTVNGICYKLDEDRCEATVISLENKNMRDVVIPDTIEVDDVDYDVTAIAKDSLRGMGMKTVKIGNNVKTIGDRAFYVCKKLESVSGGYYVNSIGNGAFRYCTSLKKFTVNSRVAKIGNDAFNGCTALKSVKFDGKSLKKIGDKAFYNCKKLTSVSGGWYIVSIGKYAFQNCSALKKFTVTSRVETIGEKAFCNCASLVNIIFSGKSLKKIGAKAFEGIAAKPSFICPYDVLDVYVRMIKNAEAPSRSTYIGR